MKVNAPPTSCKVYTPEPLADAMVRALDDKPAFHWLEPCFGEGVFLRSLLRRGVQHNRIVGVDLEQPQPWSFGVGTLHWGTDFLEWVQSRPGEFDRIVGNPPFVNLARLPVPLRSAARRLKPPSGKALSLTANYWCSFVLGCISALRRTGSLALVLPSSWDYADYAGEFRAWLPSAFSEFEVHRCKRPLFPGVQEGTVVIIGRDFGGVGRSETRVEYEDIDSLVRGVLDLETGARAVRKGSRGIVRGRIKVGLATRPLGEVMEIRLGAVTGDNSFFLLTEEERVRWGLPVECLRPVLSKARHLTCGQMSKPAWSRLREGGERVWMFCPPVRTLSHSGVQEYISHGIKGGCRLSNYKVAIRDPWHTVIPPGRADGFLSGMSDKGPWLCLRGMPHLTATNTLYVARFREPHDRRRRLGWALSLLGSVSRRAILAAQRIYADGLRKHEPGDLNGIPVVVPPLEPPPQVLYDRAIELLLSGELRASMDTADQWLETSIRSEESALWPPGPRAPVSASSCQ